MLNQLKLPYLIESSLIIALGYIIYRLLFAADKAYIRNRIYLLSLFVLSFLLPLIHLPVYAQKVVVMPSKVSESQLPSISNNIIASGFDWATIVSLVYIGVVALLSLRLIYHVVYISGIIRSNKSEIVGDVRHIITDRLSTPASIFNILLTDNKDLPQAIIDHEKVHMRHGHTWDVLLMEISKIILWFNPFVYLASRQLKDNHEYIADYLAAKSTNGKVEYSSILIQYAKSIKSPILLNTFSTITKKRIIMLSKESSTHPWKSLLIIPALCIMVSLFSCESYNVNVNPDGTKLTESNSGIRIDTITTFDYDTGKESLSIERVYVNDMVTTIDTIVVFDSDTYEEKVQIIRSESPRTEVLLETYIINELNNQTGDMNVKIYNRYPQELVQVVDTITTIDFDTYEETITIVEGARAKEELVSTKTVPKSKIKKGQKFDNVFNEDAKLITKRSGN